MAKRSSAHIKAQREGRSRDLETCQACGSKEKVQGHHILDHQFSGAALADNIVSLCQCREKLFHVCVPFHFAIKIAALYWAAPGD